MAEHIKSSRGSIRNPTAGGTARGGHVGNNIAPMDTIRKASPDANTTRAVQKPHPLEENTPSTRDAGADQEPSDMIGKEDFADLSDSQGLTSTAGSGGALVSRVPLLMGAAIVGCALVGFAVYRLLQSRRSDGRTVIRNQGIRDYWNINSDPKESGITLD